MLKTVICPICGKEQKGIDLEETDNIFICSQCNKTIKITNIDESGKIIGYNEKN